MPYFWLVWPQRLHRLRTWLQIVTLRAGCTPDYRCNELLYTLLKLHGNICHHPWTGVAIISAQDILNTINLSPLSLANSIGFVRQVTGLVLASVFRMTDLENHFRKPIAIVGNRRRNSISGIKMIGRTVKFDLTIVAWYLATCHATSTLWLQGRDFFFAAAS